MILPFPLSFGIISLYFTFFVIFKREGGDKTMVNISKGLVRTNDQCVGCNKN